MKYFLIILVILSFSCNEDNLVDPQKFIPTASDLETNISFELLSGDSVRIYSNEQSYSMRPYFKQVVIGHRNDDEDFGVWDTVDIKYDHINYRYQMNLSYIHKFYMSNFVYPYDHLEIQLQFIIDAFDFRTIFIYVYPHKYPYESAEIYLRKADIKDEPMPNSNFINTHIVGNDIYCLTSPGGHFLYKYQRYTREYEFFMFTYSEFFTYHDGYLYLDDGMRFPITKYNIAKDSIELYINREEGWGEYIFGYDIYEDKLHILHHNGPLHLSIYDLNGNRLDSFPIELSGWDISIYDDILYSCRSYRDETPRILRYNIKERKALPDLLSPSNDTYSIQVKDDNLYYTLYYRWLVCYVPLKDLREIN